MANQSVASGILTDYNGNPFLPRTTFSQVFDDSTGESLGEILEILPVPRGGTGTATHGLNSVLVGNGAGILKHISSKSGAFYATAANGEPKFGTLPVAQGGTGITSNPSMLVNLGSTTADTVFEAAPRPGITGTLGIGNGGTGATTAEQARANLGILSADDTYQYSTLRNANTVLAGPSSGDPASATFRKLVAADIPVLTTSHLPNIPNTKLPTVPISKGGTGKTTAAAAQRNLLQDMTSSAVAITDDNQLVFKYTDPDDTKGTLLYKNASLFWDYTASKMNSILGLSGTNGNATFSGVLTATSITIPNCYSSTSGQFAPGADTPEGDGYAEMKGLKISCGNSNLLMGMHTILRSESSMFLEGGANINLHSLGFMSLISDTNMTLNSAQAFYVNSSAITLTSTGGLFLRNSGLILNSSMYGSLDDMNAISSPVEGQVFFVLN